MIKHSMSLYKDKIPAFGRHVGVAVEVVAVFADAVESCEQFAVVGSRAGVEGYTALVYGLGSCQDGRRRQF